MGKEIEERSYLGFTYDNEEGGEENEKTLLSTDSIKNEDDAITEAKNLWDVLLERRGENYGPGVMKEKAFRGRCILRGYTNGKGFVQTYIKYF